MWCDHTFKKRSKTIKRAGRGFDKTRSMAGKQYRVSLLKIGSRLKPSIPYMEEAINLGEDWKRYFFKNEESAERISER